MDKDVLNLTTNEVAERLRVSVRTLKNWRAQGIGPQWFRNGPVKILYPLPAIVAYESKNLS